MSYAANPTGVRAATRQTSSAPADRVGVGRASDSDRPRGGRTMPRGRPFEKSRDWTQVAVVAGGIAAGAAIGAGLALLFTEQTGPERRSRLARRARRFGHDAEQKWEDLAFELKEAARAARDRLRLRRARKQAAADETDVDD